MPNYIGILFGRSGDDGWSEVYPITAADYTSAALVLTAVRTARVDMMCPDASLIGDRLSDTDIKGDSFDTGTSYPIPGTFTATPAPTTFNPALAVRVKVSAGTLRRGSRWVRAIPNNCVSSTGVYVPTSAFATIMDAYLNELKSGTCIATRNKGAISPPFFTFSPVTATSVQGLEKRNIGRPFALPRGRREIA